MTYSEIKTLALAKRAGTIRTITYTKQLKALKDVSSVITKTTTTQCRLGVSYDNIKAVKEYKATRPETERTGHMSGVQWKAGDEKYFIEGKNGNIQLRCTRIKGNPTKTTYYKDGVEVTKEEIKALCLKSEFPEYKEGAAPVPVFNIGIEKIISIV